MVGRSGPGGKWRELVRARVPNVESVPTTRVELIDPGAELVPENLLRFSVTFSAPMAEGAAAGRLHLLGDDGSDLSGSFLPMPPELWDRPRRRLTVLLDPGRIKRGLVPNVVAGAPLTAGSAVTFVVDRQLLDAAGAALVADASRRYLVGEPIRSRIDPKLWRLQWPEPGSDQLVVEFGRPMDRTLAARCLVAVDRHGRGMEGAAALDQAGRTWTFTPAAGTASALRLLVHPELEDLAGNSVRRVFDRDLLEPSDGPSSAGPILLSADSR